MDPIMIVIELKSFLLKEERAMLHPLLKRNNMVMNMD